MGIVASCFIARRKAYDHIDITLINLRNTRSLLEEKIEVLDKRSVKLRDEAKEHVKNRLKQSALIKLHNAKVSQDQARRTGAYVYRLTELYNYIEQGLVTLAAADTMKQAQQALEDINSQIKVEEVEEMLQTIRENIERLQEATDLISSPDSLGQQHQYNEEELERELALLSAEQDQAPLFPPAPVVVPIDYEPSEAEEGDAASSQPHQPEPRQGIAI